MAGASASARAPVREGTAASPLLGPFDRWPAVLDKKVSTRWHAVRRWRRRGSRARGCRGYRSTLLVASRGVQRRCLFLQCWTPPHKCVHPTAWRTAGRPEVATHLSKNLSTTYSGQRKQAHDTTTHGHSQRTGTRGADYPSVSLEPSRAWAAHDGAWSPPSTPHEFCKFTKFWRAQRI